jgi:hypothetical protein
MGSSSKNADVGPRGAAGDDDIQLVEKEDDSAVGSEIEQEGDGDNEDEEGGDGDGEDGTHPWINDITSDTRANTPGTKKTRADCWQTIKRLKPTHRMSVESVGEEKEKKKVNTLVINGQTVKEGFTHVCVIKGCPDPFMKLLKPPKKTYWVTTPCIKHAREHHADTTVAVASLKREDESNKKLAVQQLDYGIQQNPVTASAEAKGKKMKQSALRYSLTPKQEMLSSQAAWYVYSKQMVTKSTFKDRYFIQMQLAGRKAGEGAVLSKYMLRRYVRAEYEVFKKFLQIIIELKIKQGHGNPFGQVIHDGVTLANHKKYQSIGLQFIDPNWLANLVVCVGFERSTDNTDVGVARLVSQTFINVLGHRLDEVMACMVSDRAAIGVSTAVGLEEREGCDMHDADKVGQSAIGTLVRSTLFPKAKGYAMLHAKLLHISAMGNARMT